MRQTLAIIRLEIRKNFLSRRALLLYPIAGLPIFLLSMLALFPPDTDEMKNFGMLGQVYAGRSGGLILRTLVFFGCAWVFMNLFRGEVVDRSLQYYFLSPVRHQVLVAGKYLSGTHRRRSFCSVSRRSVDVDTLLRDLPVRSSAIFFRWRGCRPLLAYLGVTILACIGYGACFSLVGLFFRNPIIPGLLLYGWEWINFLLPPG